MYGKKGHNLESEIQAESWTYKCLEIDVDKHLSEQERISQSHPGDILCSVSQKLLLFLHIWQMFQFIFKGRVLHLYNLKWIIWNLV